MLNRTAQSGDCAVFSVDFSAGDTANIFAFSYFCFFVFLLFAPARAGLAGGPANISVVSSG